jgi:hypothetical protein
MTVTPPITIARDTLLALLTTEFTADGFLITGDKLHKSLGHDGQTRIGVSPIQEIPWQKDNNVALISLLVQFYGAWEARIDPELQVDPDAVEVYAERFKRRLQGNDPDVATAWYFNLADIVYPEDPTGNITRFEAKVTTYGTNTSLVATTG